jgi:hypothetical protein
MLPMLDVPLPGLIMMPFTLVSQCQCSCSFTTGIPGNTAVGSYVMARCLPSINRQSLFVARRADHPPPSKLRATVAGTSARNKLQRAATDPYDKE